MGCLCVWFWLLLGVIETQEADLVDLNTFSFVFNSFELHVRFKPEIYIFLKASLRTKNAILIVPVLFLSKPKVANEVQHVLQHTQSPVDHAAYSFLV